MASEATDMRCGFDRLAERVRAVIGEDPQSGHLFVFRSRRGDRLKIWFGSATGSCCGTSAWRSGCSRTLLRELPIRRSFDAIESVPLALQQSG